MRIEDSPKDCIRTNSGIYINIFEPTLDMLCIEDMAHALAAQPRFAGHLNKHYSVAQHSVLAARRASKKNRLATLLHDGTEAYMLDMPTPIKARMPEYKQFEHNFSIVIAEKFGFKYPYHPEVKEIDSYMLHLEWDSLVIKNKKSFKCWSQKKAKRKFLEMYYEITGK